MRALAITVLLGLFGLHCNAAPTCSVSLENRESCGLGRVSQEECLAQGCCFEMNPNTINWCYRQAGSDPCSTNPCQPDESCVSSGTTYTCICPAGRVAVGGKCVTPSNEECAVAVSDRQSCGWIGISQSECADQGCCYEQNANTIGWCYRKAGAVDPCAANPCNEDETCKSSGSGYTCSCAGGKTGETCNQPADAVCASITPEYRELCGYLGISESACQGQGCCYQINADSIFFCYKKQADPCSSSPCGNGGVCTRTGQTDFSCECSSEWTGPTCTTPSNPCEAKPCKNGGTCTPGAAGSEFTCACVPGWKGSDCSIDNNVCLESSPCKNGGTCTKSGDSYICKCPPTWAGSDCDTSSEECKAIVDRSNCGWSGVTPDECNENSCCFDDSRTSEGYASCFSAVNECEDMPMDVRADCGFVGVSYWQCMSRGCCYDDDPDFNPGPVCYRRANKACLGVPADQRVQQGSDIIEPNYCVFKGWCWDSSAEPNCFTRAE